MSKAEWVYQRLPVFLQNLACSAAGLRINWRRYNVEFDRILCEYEGRLAATSGELTSYRDEQVALFVKHAAASVPFYRKWLGNAGVSASEIVSLQDLLRLPVLQKAEVQKNLSGLVSEAISARDCQQHHTSGTTGTGLVFPTTFEAQRRQWAVWWRYREGLGIDRSLWCGLFGGRRVVPRSQTRPPFWRTSLPHRRVLFSGYHLRPDWLDAYIAEIQRRKLPWLHGYPSHLTLIAQRALETGVVFEPTMRFVTIGAESLLAHQKETMQRAFKCSVRQHYGLAEACANISECAFGRLHVDEDFAAVEFLPIPGTDGYRIIGTNFTNPAFPLIRYDTGDIAYGVEESNSCRCGRAGRTVARIDGRIEDRVVLKDGTQIGRLDHILKDMTTVREAQFVQKGPGRLVLRIVRSAEYSAGDERRIRDESVQRLGPDIQLDFEYHERLYRAGSGKLRFVVSEPDQAGKHPAS